MTYRPLHVLGSLRRLSYEKVPQMCPVVSEIMNEAANKFFDLEPENRTLYMLNRVLGQAEGTIEDKVTSVFRDHHVMVIGDAADLQEENDKLKVVIQDKDTQIKELELQLNNARYFTAQQEERDHQRPNRW